MHFVANFKLYLWDISKTVSISIGSIAKYMLFVKVNGARCLNSYTLFNNHSYLSPGLSRAKCTNNKLNKRTRTKLDCSRKTRTLSSTKLIPCPNNLSPNSTVLPGREKREITLNFSWRTFCKLCLLSASKLLSNFRICSETKLQIGALHRHDGQRSAFFFQNVLLV